MNILKSDWTKIMYDIHNKELKEIEFKEEVSLVVYLVSPDYPHDKGNSYEFEINVKEIENNNIKVLFSSSEHIKDNVYKTVGTSRCVALSTTANTMEESQNQIYTNIEKYTKGMLEYRTDIGNY